MDIYHSISSKLNLAQWCELDERIYMAETDEQYKQYAGFDYSETLIRQLAAMRMRNAKIFPDTFYEPRELVLGSIESIADAKTKKLELKLHNLRNSKIISNRHQVNNSRVNWSTWRQFNNIEKDLASRKQVFDEFLAKTRYIAPIIENRFLVIKEIYSEFENTKSASRRQHELLNPLSAYLENEKVPYPRLLKLVKHMGDAAKKPFRKALDIVTQQVLQRDADYFDDFYFFRNKIYSDLERIFYKLDPIREVHRVLKLMDLDHSNIHFDVENRKNKYPSPICFFIHVPCDVRILYKSENAYFDLQSCFHETGHAMHATSIDSETNYWDRYRIPMGIAEIFSILLERLSRNSHYLNSVLHHKNNQQLLDELLARSNFMELFFVTFYTANSLMKMEFWKSNLSIESANDLYAKLIKEYTGFDMPGEYWMLHHILPEAIMYVPSYLLAAVRAAELEMHIQSRVGESWWKEREAGKMLQEIMKPGAKIDLRIFSKLDTSIFIKEIISTY